MDQIRFYMDGEDNQILADARIDGNLKSDKGICLDGMILGNVHSAKQIIIHKDGVINGDVDCNELYIEGQITGNVCVACKTVMCASAVIGGGLITNSLEITPGAKIGRGLKLKNASK